MDISPDQRRQLNVIATIAIARLLLLSATLDVLSPRELHVLDLRSKGAMLSEIAAEMRISRNGVNYLLREAKIKLGVAHTTEAIRICVRRGLLS